MELGATESLMVLRCNACRDIRKVDSACVLLWLLSP